MLTFRRLCRCVSILTLTAGVLAAEKPKLINDTAKRSAIKTVAVLSVYGPEKTFAGFSNFKEQTLYDAVETDFVKRLEQTGLTVIPPAQSKAALQSQFVDAYLTNARSEIKKNAATLRPAIEKGYAVTYNAPASSENTRLLFGTDMSFLPDPKKPTKTFSDEKDYEQTPAAYDEALVKALGILAPNLGVDAVILLRVIPEIPTNTGKKVGRFNLNPIKDGLNKIKAVKEGDHGVVTLDMAMYNSATQLVFNDQIIKASEEGTGKGGGFNLKVSEDAAAQLLVNATDLALQKLFEDFTGKAAK